MGTGPEPESLYEVKNLRFKTQDDQKETKRRKKWPKRGRMTTKKLKITTDE